MNQLLPEQIEALLGLKQACDQAQADTVVIGATAYRVWIDDDRHTEDVDVAIALDVDRISIVTNHLVGHGWIPDKRREECWLTRASGSIASATLFGQTMNHRTFLKSKR